MEWSQEETFRFLELFQKEHIIWDPKDKSHKNSKKVNDAWERLSVQMGRSSSDLKFKKKSFMATFRQHLRRKKQSLKSGAGEDDVYKPVWLYYDAMETFLASVYKCHATINTEEGHNEGLISPVLPNVDDVDDETHDNNELMYDQSHKQSDKQKPANNKKTFKSPIKRKRLREDCETDIHRNIKDTVSNLNSILLNRKDNDECDLYAQLLVTRLREYSKQQRRQIMHSIDRLLLVNPPEQTQNFDIYSRYTPSPTYSSSSSCGPQQSSIQIRPTSRDSYVSQPQQSPVEISIPDRPTSSDSYVSQPQRSPVQLSIPYRSTSHNSYVLQPHVSGVMSSHSPTATVLPSQNCVTILSQEVIQRSDSQNIIDTAFINALNDEP